MRRDGSSHQAATEFSGKLFRDRTPGETPQQEIAIIVVSVSDARNLYAALPVKGMHVVQARSFGGNGGSWLHLRRDPPTNRQCRPASIGCESETALPKGGRGLSCCGLRPPIATGETSAIAEALHMTPDQIR